MDDNTMYIGVTGNGLYEFPVKPGQEVRKVIVNVDVETEQAETERGETP